MKWVKKFGLNIFIVNADMLEFTVLTQSDQSSSHVELNRLIRFVVFLRNKY